MLVCHLAMHAGITAPSFLQASLKVRASLWLMPLSVTYKARI